ncbi:glucuronate isomerase [Nesterenkonia sp. PF2B19]|uniref:glucuronate isomerase n=1 Tax=unclassified Nesterenkonia TaxID=2629769 RepID=UPI00087246C6|nr:glucuronate isomerase [Nesterenkonia sp. PF2B19]OSM44022.1 glucuronate isomerase [Nesterenkonia sp. PF2B19]
MPTEIADHADRLLPADPRVREIARDLHAEVEALPIVSPHGHVDAAMLADDTPFPDPTALLISPDHYVTRLIHANGVPLEQLRVGGSAEVSPREAWRIFCAHWADFDGTASGYWLRQEFTGVFGIDDSTITEDRADELYDAISERIAAPDFRPRALFDQFGIEVLATTDDPLDDLEAHRRLAEDPTFTGRVLPTFRPDRYLKFGPEFRQVVEALVETVGGGVSGYAGYLRALQARRGYFIDHGAVSADHGAHTPRTLRMDKSEAEALFEKGMTGTATLEEARAFEAHMMYQMAQMSAEDGLVMTVHPGVHRNTHTPTLERFGPDTGHDIPFAVDYSSGLRPVLEDFGTVEGFHLIPFTIDESVYSREIAPLAGFYPSVFVGAPWWFLDAPDAMLRFRAAVTETTGFTRSSGFIDDTRAFCSIPARHDASRRVEASFLARLVAEHRITEARAHQAIVELVDTSPRRAFKL